MAKKTTPAKSQKPAPRKRPTKVKAEQIREMVLPLILRMMNQGGMHAYHLDAVASKLDLKIGHITYHFHRKESAVMTLWERYITEYRNLERGFTEAADLRQVFVFNLNFLRLNYKYRGVVMFRGGDLAAIANNKVRELSIDDQQQAAIREAIDLLTRNGYLIDQAPKNLTDTVAMQYDLALRWGLNAAYHLYTPHNVGAKLEHMALVALHALYPLLTEKGRNEFAKLAEEVEAGTFQAELAPIDPDTLPTPPPKIRKNARVEGATGKKPRTPARKKAETPAKKKAEAPVGKKADVPAKRRGRPRKV